MLVKRLEKIQSRLDEIERKMSDPAVISDPKRMGELSKKHSELLPVVQAGKEYMKLRDDLASLDEYGDDPEMVEFAEEERPRLEERLESLEQRIRLMLVPKDPDEERNAILEIRAGTGGEEAGLFVSDLLRMYTRFVERRGWTPEIISQHPTELGGFKEIILQVKGKGAFGALRFEGGVHRVQRVPETEASGRIHTSAVTVAVLPEATEVDVAISPEDIRIDVFRSSGPGGQSVNTTDSAVRITHIPTGLVVSCQDEKSQHKNRAKAMKVLQSRLLDRQRAEAHAQRADLRKSLVKSGDRSDRIRTYNFPQSRLTDHRISFTTHNLPRILEGEIDELVETLQREDLLKRMEGAEEAVAAGVEGRKAG